MQASSVKEVISISHGNSVRGSVRPHDLSDILDGIASGRWKSLVKLARQRYVPGQKESAELAKGSLPIICTGRFADRPTPGHKTNRTNDNFIGAQALIVDIDHLCPEDEASLPTDPDAIAELKGDLADEHNGKWISARVHAAWRSPSGDGLKLLFIIDQEVLGADAFKALALHVIHKIYEEYGGTRADLSCTDAARATFVSFDPLMYRNDNAIPIEYSELKDELSKEDDIDESVSIALRDNSQAEIFIAIARKIRVIHYKTFRDLCSAVSRLGQPVLEAFYDTLFGACSAELSEQTRAALSARDKYVASFMQEHERVPLQFVIDYAVRQGYDMTAHKNKTLGGDPLFDITAQVKAAIDWMNERFATFGEGSGVIVLPRRQFRAVERLAGASFNSDSMIHKIRRVADIRFFMQNKVIRYLNGAGKAMKIPYFDSWLSSVRRRDVGGIVCDPRQAPGMTREKGTYNEWQGFNISGSRLERAMKLEEERGTLLCQPILDFVHHVLADECKPTGDYILNWVAEMIQNAGAINKPGVCLVLVSEAQGTGKGTFDEFLRDLIGPIHSVMLQDSGLITGQFNQILQGKLLVTLDEAIYSRDKRAWQTMKSLLAGADMTIHPKFMTPYQVPNIARFMVLSNSRHVVDAELDDRRYYIVEVSKRAKENIPYFTELRKCWTNGGKESFYNYLLGRKFDRESFLLSRTKLTSIMKANRLGSMDAFNQWVSRTIHWARITKKDGTLQSLSADKLTQVDYAVLFNDYIEFCRSIGANYEKSETAFRQQLFHSGFALDNIMTVWADGGYRSFVNIPSLKELHEKFPLHSDGAVIPSATEEDDLNF